MRDYAAILPTDFLVAPVVDQQLGTRMASDDCQMECADEWEHLWIEIGGEG